MFRVPNALFQEQASCWFIASTSLKLCVTCSLPVLSDFGSDLKPTKAVPDLIIVFPGFQLLFFTCFMTNCLVFPYLKKKKTIHFLTDAAVKFCCMFLTPTWPTVQLRLSEPPSLVNPALGEHARRRTPSAALPEASCHCRNTQGAGGAQGRGFWQIPGEYPVFPDRGHQPILGLVPLGFPVPPVRPFGSACPISRSGF